MMQYVHNASKGVGNAVGAVGSGVGSAVGAVGHAVSRPFTGSDPKPTNSASMKSNTSVDSEEFTEDEIPVLDEDQLRSKEGALSYMLRSARNKYIERGLVGKITIQMLYGVVLSGEYCTVSKHDKLDALEDADVNQLSSLNFKALSSMDAIFANLSRRSKAREAVDHMADTTLTQGITFGFSFPLIISFGFQVYIQFEVTVASIVAYRKKKERLRLIQSKLKAIPNAIKFIEEVKASGGFSTELAQKAVIATKGTSAEDALRWAISHDEALSINKEELASCLKAIPNSENLVAEVRSSGGFSRLLAEKAVVATNGTSAEDALRWAITHDREFLSVSPAQRGRSHSKDDGIDNQDARADTKLSADAKQ